MSDDGLAALADAAGLARTWRDAFGQGHDVSPDTMVAILDRLGLPAASAAQIRESRDNLQTQRAATTSSLITADAGAAVTIPGLGDQTLRLVLEDGQPLDITPSGGTFIAPDVIGYHRLELGDRGITLAVAPPRCVTIADLVGSQKLWGLAVQLYSLRRHGDGGIGDFTTLGDFARQAAAQGAATLAISPLHAQFSADVSRFSPYAPSSRVMLNVLHVDAGGRRDPLLEDADLIDWPVASTRKLARLRELYDKRSPATDHAFAAFRDAHGGLLHDHAVFEALHGHFYGADPAKWHWRNWGDAYRTPDQPAVQAFARDHADTVNFHAYLQFLADQGLADAQRAAREAGMPIGLISDLAVGTDDGGSHGWTRQDETLLGLSIGAPPDLLSTAGQDWGLTAFSPLGLHRNGFRGFIEMLRTALRHAGGVRIDHVMGLARLWVMPSGASAADGAYLHFPMEDLFRLVALESHRHRAIVLGEDLGTVPHGFNERLARAGIMGLRVLWFERDHQQNFTAPVHWTKSAVAMTSTHDLPTVAGWWEGRDLDWRADLHLMRDEAQERGDRDRDRGLLWQAFRHSGAAAYATPPARDEGHHVAGSAAVHIGRAACDLALLPIEDALARREQPNLPGTTTEHPNWRRRMPGLATNLLDDDAARERLAALNAARG
jgi:4-alpha-glucanotransferase